MRRTSATNGGEIDGGGLCRRIGGRDDRVRNTVIQQRIGQVVSLLE